MPSDSADAGAWGRDEIRNITGRSSHETDSPTSLPDGAFYKGTTRIDIQSGGLTSDTEVCFDASRVVPTGPQNVPQHIWQPYVIYLGLTV